MPTGSCLCGDIKVEYTGEPTYTARPTPSGIQVFQIPNTNFAITAGEPKIFTKQSDHGRDIHTHFCPRCGTALFRTGGAPEMADYVGLRAGVLDDQSILDKPPMVEVYVERRMKWLKPVDGAMQLDAQYQVVQ
ncbi:hypothetical protein MBLNU13_g10622t2 [Cladosporium sp. NU13]